MDFTVFLVAAQTSSSPGYALVSFRCCLPENVKIGRGNFGSPLGFSPCPALWSQKGLITTVSLKLQHAQVLSQNIPSFFPIVTLLGACALSSKGIPKTALRSLHWGQFISKQITGFEMQLYSSCSTLRGHMQSKCFQWLYLEQNQNWLATYLYWYLHFAEGLLSSLGHAESLKENVPHQGKYIMQYRVPKSLLHYYRTQSFIHITHAQTSQLWLRKKTWSQKKYFRDAKNGSFLNGIHIKCGFFSMQLLQGWKGLHLMSYRSNLQSVVFISSTTVSTEDEMTYKWLVNTTITL